MVQITFFCIYYERKYQEITFELFVLLLNKMWPTFLQFFNMRPFKNK